MYHYPRLKDFVTLKRTITNQSEILCFPCSLRGGNGRHESTQIILISFILSSLIATENFHNYQDMFL